jgi:hypothetical protein
MRVESASARYTVERSDSQLQVTIPARSHPVAALVWALWLCALVVGPGFSGRLFSRLGADPFEWVMLAFWTGLALIGVASILWITTGREQITIAGDTLVNRMSIGPLGYSHRYCFAETNSYRVSSKYAAYCGGYRAFGLPAGMARGTIQFEYHGRTRYLGAGLDETEATQLFRVLEPLVEARPRRTRSQS